ncbi:unnamed protein product [Effrenium voratum]|nr:unnamed protein product [Effrenium voratum]
MATCSLLQHGQSRAHAHAGQDSNFPYSSSCLCYVWQVGTNNKSNELSASGNVDFSVLASSFPCQGRWDIASFLRRLLRRRCRRKCNRRNSQLPTSTQHKR